jgi:histidine triad (HIT) family protein
MDGSETDCIFCNIVRGKASANLVYEDEFVVGFWDANPSRPIHILIVPRTHIATLNDISEDNHILSHIGQAAAKIAADLGVADSGYRLLINVNREGGQVIFHLHAHLMAGRKKGSI